MSGCVPVMTVFEEGCNQCSAVSLCVHEAPLVSSRTTNLQLMWQDSSACSCHDVTTHLHP